MRGVTRHGGWLWLVGVLGCGDPGLDPDTLGRDLEPAERTELCVETLEHLSDPSFSDVACGYNAVRATTEPTACVTNYDECIGRSTLPQAALEERCTLSGFTGMTDCGATVGEILDCTRAHLARLREFYAEWQCTEASADPVSAPPVATELAECVDVLSLCPELWPAL